MCCMLKNLGRRLSLDRPEAVILSRTRMMHIHSHIHSGPHPHPFYLEDLMLVYASHLNLHPTTSTQIPTPHPNLTHDIIPTSRSPTFPKTVKKPAQSGKAPQTEKTFAYMRLHSEKLFHQSNHNKLAYWPNGKASDYDSIRNQEIAGSSPA